MYYNYTYCTIVLELYLLYYNCNYWNITESTNLINLWRSFYYCTTTKRDKLRTLIQKPNLYYFTVSESAKLGYYCTTLLCKVWTKSQHINSKSCINAKRITYFETFLLSSPAPKTCCLSCITFLYILLYISFLHDTIQP